MDRRGDRRTLHWLAAAGNHGWALAMLLLAVDRAHADSVFCDRAASIWTVCSTLRMHLSSWRPMERRIEILKDSHAGAFAILICVVYFFLLYAVTDMVTVDMLPVYAMLFVVSRSLKRSVCRELPRKMKKEGTVADFSKKAETGRIRVTLIFYLVLAITGMFILNPLYGAAAMAGAFFDLRLVLSDGNEEFWRQ